MSPNSNPNTPKKKNMSRQRSPQRRSPKPKPVTFADREWPANVYWIVGAELAAEFARANEGGAS